MGGRINNMKTTTKCSRCHISKYANPRALERRIKKYGSIENIENEWICQNCTRIEKEINRDPLTEEEIDKLI